MNRLISQIKDINEENKYYGEKKECWNFNKIVYFFKIISVIYDLIIRILFLLTL